MQQSTQMESQTSIRPVEAVESLPGRYTSGETTQPPTRMPDTTDRRDAIRQIAGGALALAALGSTACATPGIAASTPGPRPSPGGFDMSWMKRVNKKRRMAFDTFEVQGGAGLAFVAAYLEGA